MEVAISLMVVGFVLIFVLQANSLKSKNRILNERLMQIAVIIPDANKKHIPLDYNQRIELQSVLLPYHNQIKEQQEAQ